MASRALQTPDSYPYSSSHGRLIERGCEILAAEVAALSQLGHRLEASFARGVELLLHCEGSVLVTGMGKAGLVGQKLTASLSSTGTPSHFLHPAEAVHGDLGCIRPSDVIVVLSYSGETEEITRILPLLGECAAGLLAITARTDSTLGRAANVTLPLGEHREAGSLGLAPTTSTTAMMALGDALALVVSEQRGFTREQFARFHPAGNLGRQLTGVCEIMRPLTECRVAGEHQSLREVLVRVSRPGRRSGAIMLTNNAGQLVGIFTDSDLARLLERSQDAQLDQPVNRVMKRAFTTVTAGCLLPEAMRLLAERKISELPVVDENQQPLGMLDVTDLVSSGSTDWPTARSSSPERRMAAAFRVVRD